MWMVVAYVLWLHVGPDLLEASPTPKEMSKPACVSSWLDVEEDEPGKQADQEG